jgi:hypothetical protein
LAVDPSPAATVYFECDVIAPVILAAAFRHGYPFDALTAWRPILLVGMQLFPASQIEKAAAEPRSRQSCLEPCGVMPARLLCCAVQQARLVSPPIEGMTLRA